MKTYEESTRSIINKIREDEEEIKKGYRRKEPPKILVIAAGLILVIGLIGNLDIFKKSNGEKVDFDINRSSQTYNESSSKGLIDSFIYNDITYNVKVEKVELNEVFDETPIVESNLITINLLIDGKKHIITSNETDLEKFYEGINYYKEYILR